MKLEVALIPWGILYSWDTSKFSNFLVDHRENRDESMEIVWYPSF